MSRPVSFITLLVLLNLATACAPFLAQCPPSAPVVGQTVSTGPADSTPPIVEEDTMRAMPPTDSSLLSPTEEAPPTDEIRAELFLGEISQLETIANNPSSSPTERSDSLRRLALLHLSPNNPAYNLDQATTAQAAYLETLAPGALRQEGEIWLGLLKTAREGENLRKQRATDSRGKDKALAALVAEKQRLLQKITVLEAGNAKLEGDIEKLKLIDLSMEKKRKGSP